MLQVDTADALEEEVNQMRENLERRLREREVAFEQTRVSEGGDVEIVGVPQETGAILDEVLDEYSSGWTYQTRTREGKIDAAVRMIAAYRKYLATESVRQARDIVSNRVDQYGVAEPTITVYGSGDVQDQIIVELPGVEDFERVKKLIKDTARLELKLTHPSQGGPYPNREAALSAFGGSLPEEYEVLAYRDRDQTAGQALFLVVRRTASVSGQHLKNAKRSQDPFTGKSEVVFLSEQ